MTSKRCKMWNCSRWDFEFRLVGFIRCESATEYKLKKLWAESRKLSGVCQMIYMTMFFIDFLSQKCEDTRRASNGERMQCWSGAVNSVGCFLSVDVTRFLAYMLGLIHRKKDRIGPSSQNQGTTNCEYAIEIRSVSLTCRSIYVTNSNFPFTQANGPI